MVRWIGLFCLDLIINYGAIVGLSYDTFRLSDYQNTIYGEHCFSARTSDIIYQFSGGFLFVTKILWFAITVLTHLQNICGVIWQFFTKTFFAWIMVLTHCGAQFFYLSNLLDYYFSICHIGSVGSALTQAEDTFWIICHNSPVHLYNNIIQSYISP